MKFLVCLACTCLFLLAGSVLSVQSQSEPVTRGLSCDNGVCKTTVTESGGGWTQTINCGDEEHVFYGTGSYGGSVCGITMN